MRKLFSFCAAMLVALAANATIWNITNSEEGNLRRCLRDNVGTGDTVVLADGEYAEDQSYNVMKDVVIMAAEGARPVINQTSYLNLYASAKIIGIKFKYVGTSDGYCIYFRKNSEKYLALEGCEFQGFTNYAFTSWEAFHIDSCIVNNCYFHDFAKGAFYFPKSTLPNDSNACDKLQVTNSTFANITLNEVAVLDLRNNNNSTAATSELIVDHCTFYNCQGYERMIQTYKTPKGSVSNCIMMNTEVTPATYATYLYGGEVHNCLSWQTKGHRDWDTHPTITNCSDADPLFVDAAKGNFMLAAGSPAIGAATDGSNLGDPFWNAKTLYLNPGVWNTAGAKFAIFTFGSGSHDAQWSGFMTEVEESGIFTTDIPAGFPKIIYGRINGDATTPNWDDKWNQSYDLDVPPSKDQYAITDWGDGNSPGEWSKHNAKFYIAGSMTNWSDFEMIGSTEDSYTLKLDAGNHQLKVIDASNGAWLGYSDLTEAEKAVEIYSIGGNICFTLAAAGNVKVTFIKDEVLKLEGDFVLPTFQLTGDIAGGWDKTVTLTPAENKLTASVKLNLSEWYYEFKVIYAGGWFGKENGESKYEIKSDWNWVDGLTYAGDNIILKPNLINKDYTITWTYATGKLEVTFPSDVPSAIDNTEAASKAVKSIENGMLIIEKAGIKYNVMGQVIK